MVSRGFRLILLLAIGAAVGVLIETVRKQRAVAISTVDDIEAQIAALDPATRASVIARLTKDAVDTVRDRAGA
jgi:hypothetical protein